MAYCKFENTLHDLRDCVESLNYGIKVANFHEKNAQIELIKLCVEIADNYGDTITGDRR